MRSKMRPICWYHSLVTKSFLEATKIQNFEGCKKIIYVLGEARNFFFSSMNILPLWSPFFKGKRVVIFYFAKKVSKNIEMLWFRFSCFLLQRVLSSSASTMKPFGERSCGKRYVLQKQHVDEKQRNKNKKGFWRLVSSI